MDLTSTDILVGLGAAAAAVVVACGVYWIGGRHRAATGPAAAAPGTDPHGRHRAPEELLRASTYRLTADRIARAKVEGPDRPDQVSQAMPSPSRSRS
jgi:hypothetical protein